MLSNEEKKRKNMKLRLVFISVNNNELPVPYRDDKEYVGYTLAEEMLHDIWRRRVSHVEMVPKENAYEIRYVIDGIVSSGIERPREEALEAIIYLKAVAGLDVEDRRRPQRGSFFTIRTGESETGWRIFTSGSTRGEQVKLERIEQQKAIQIEELGLHSDQLEKLIETVKTREGGIVLVTGTPGSGVSTTLYSFVRRHDAFTQNIYTLEKNILSDMDNVTQHHLEVGPEVIKSSARQLQTVLHGDPDVTMVGFCDEPEMAKISTKTALAGKLFYIGFNAPTVFHALQYWMKMVDNPERVSKTLLAITNQRLIRILCRECRQAYSPDMKMLKKLNMPADKIKEFYRPPTEIEYDKKGNPILCPNCQGTGYFGRTAVYETLFISEALRKVMAENAPINVISTQCRKERMLYLQEQALRKVMDGTTSIHEVLRITGEDGGKKTSVKPEAQ